MDNNPEMLATAGSILPFPLKFPEESKSYFLKTIKRVNSLV
jgi:hypothetical protein